MGLDAGYDGVKPASSIVIQNGQISHPSRCLMYGARWDNVICGLIGGASLAIQSENETPFAHEQVKTPNTSPQAIEPNPR